MNGGQSTESSNTPIIIGILILCSICCCCYIILGAGGGYYYYSKNKKDTTESLPPPTTQSQSTPTSNPTPTQPPTSNPTQPPPLISGPSSPIVSSLGPLTDEQIAINQLKTSKNITATYCSKESAECNITDGPKTVWYGEGTNWASVPKNNGKFICTTANLKIADPSPGKYKHCLIDPTLPQPVPLGYELLGPGKNDGLDWMTSRANSTIVDCADWCTNLGDCEGFTYEPRSDSVAPGVCYKTTIPTPFVGGERWNVYKKN